MKKSLSILFLMLLLLIWGCKTTTEEEKPALELAKEEWHLEEATLSGRGVVSVSGASVPVSIKGNGENYDMTLDFGDMDQLVTAAGSFVFDVDLIALGFTLQNEKIPVQGVEIFSGTWELVGDQLVITDNEEAVILEVIDYSDNILRLSGEIEVSDFERLQEDGLTVSETNIEVVLVR
ncbi:hypothetical protein [uncultured Cyclobacterium sp.]|uniref:hypothetical protein n=1 Tax=uncultured Cyclobacterium sp. TaxID=453820 RepID=UPI0030EC38A9|tara:strand:- start:113039 stop:113572 length:534 start_codon:yes stop_codon:yes gene_type:complete